MKRGEVVDAETAENIVNDVRHIDQEVRPIIWPESQANKAWNPAEYDMSLDSFPCHRPLVHLICHEEGIFCLRSLPLPAPDGYLLLIAVKWTDYDGNKQEEIPVVGIVPDEKTKRTTGKRASRLFKISVVSVEELIKKIDGETLTEAEDMLCDFLGMAIALETYAFSPYTTIRQRPYKKGRPDPTPFPRQWSSIEIVNLRMPEKREHSETTGKKLNLRFPVKEHLRRQPTKQGIKLITIAQHWRGPKDAPIKPEIPKVYKVIK